jgi:hypothetical protein
VFEIGGVFRKEGAVIFMSGSETAIGDERR